MCNRLPRRKYRSLVSTIEEYICEPVFWSFCFEKHVQICLSTCVSASGRIWHWREKRGVISCKHSESPEHGETKILHAKGGSEQFWQALWVLWLPTGRKKKTKQTKERNKDQKRHVQVKRDYKRQIFRSRAKQFGTFLKGNMRIMVFNPVFPTGFWQSCGADVTN